MRKVIMWNMVTLDGYFNGNKPFDIDFHNYAWGDELQEFSEGMMMEVGGLLFGRVTYEGMAAYWPTAEGEGGVTAIMNSVRKYVFSNTLDKAEWNNSELIKGDAVKAVADLKQLDGKDLYLFGSAKLADPLRKAGLIDEYRLCVAPVILGSGEPLFKTSDKEQGFKLLEARPLKTGGVILRYVPTEG